MAFILSNFQFVRQAFIEYPEVPLEQQDPVKNSACTVSARSWNLKQVSCLYLFRQGISRNLQIGVESGRN